MFYSTVMVITSDEIGGLCGFDNPESFSRAYKKQFGETASQARQLSW